MCRQINSIKYWSTFQCSIGAVTGGSECPNDYKPNKVSLPSGSSCDGTENRLVDCGAGPKPVTCSNCSSIVWVQCEPSEYS